MAGFAVLDVVLSEGLNGLALSVVFASQSDTRWAPGYSPCAFRMVRVGDSQEKVKQALGEPLQKAEAVYDGKRVIYWKYTIGPSKSHFHARWLLFDNAGLVTEKVSEFYVD
jgi:hypothetical protein